MVFVVARLCSARASFIVMSAMLLLCGCESSENPRVGDITMDYAVHGSGYPLLMIMGYSGTKDMWDPTLIDLLSERYRVITFNNRGISGTTSGTMPFSIEQFADDAAGLMDALEIDNAYVLGWSMGTEIAQELTLRHPDKVKKLILYAADCRYDLFPPDEAAIDQITENSSSGQSDMSTLELLVPEQWLGNPVNLEYIGSVFSGVTETVSPESIALQDMAMENWPGCCDRLGQIACPVLLITGSEDILTPPENSAFMAPRIPDSELVVFDGGGHGVMYQYPAEFATALLDFLEK